MGAVPLRLIEPQPLFQVWPGGGQLAASEQGGPQGVVGLKQKVRVVEALSQAQELLSQCPLRLIVASRVIHHPEAPQHAKELRWFSHLTTQLAGPGVQPFHLRGASALGRPQRHAEGHLHGQLLLAARAALRQRGEQV
jgi:hypothetical protein